MKKTNRILLTMVLTMVLIFGLGMNVLASPKTKTVKILNQGFMNNGTIAGYGVFFTDGFEIRMMIPKERIGTKERVLLSIIKGKGVYPKNVNIVGFSETFSERYYPLSVNNYAEYTSKETIALYKQMDFFSCLKVTKSNAKSVCGYVVYDSFVKLEGISYDDGIHKGRLYLEDK